MCNHIFQPNVWEETYNATAVPTSDIPCNRPTISGSKYCKYHAETADRRKNGTTDKQVFIDLLSQEESIFGAEFQDVRLYPGDLEEVDREWVELKNVVVHNLLKKEGISLDIHFTYNCCDIHRYKEKRTTINSYRKFDGCWFHDEFVMEPSITHADIRFDNSCLLTPLLMSGSYNGSVLFDRCSLEEGAAIWNAQFNHNLRFEQGTINDDLIIDDTDFKNNFKLTDVSLPAVNVISDCDIESIKWNPDDTGISLVDFRKDTVLHTGRLLTPNPKFIFYDVSFITLKNVRLSTGMNDLTNYYFEDTRFDGFDFFPYRTQLESENFQLHTFDYPYNEFDSHELNNYPQISSQSEIDDTHKGQLKDQEETYARAKVQAQNMGASRFASGFFFNQKEAELLRLKDDLTLPEETLRIFELNHGYVRQHVNKLSRPLVQLHNDICTNPRKWVKKEKYRMLKSSCGYGEKASYPLVWSILIIGGFGLLYPFVGGTTQSGFISLGICTSDCLSWIELLKIFGESLYFSGITFTSLSFGGNSPVGIVAELIAMIQALLGALFIALFIFTLGRQVSR